MGNTSAKPKFGYNVLKVQPGSPGDMAGLCAFFDFIVKAENTILDKENDDFTRILQMNLDKEVPLSVYNSKHDTVRTVRVIPSSTWGGKGLLGVSIRFCSVQGAIEFVWHVLEVFPNSPAEAAGLQAFKDYIVGTPDIVFNDSEDFYTLISANLDKPVQLYVYNLDTDGIRVVTLTPHKGWGGSGSLGCNVGYGYLHRIPHKRETALHMFTGDAKSGTSIAQPDIEGAPDDEMPVVGALPATSSTVVPMAKPSVPLVPVSVPAPSTPTTFASSPFITPLPSSAVTPIVSTTTTTPSTSFASPSTSLTSATLTPISSSVASPQPTRISSITTDSPLPTSYTFATQQTVTPTVLGSTVTPHYFTTPTTPIVPTTTAPSYSVSSPYVPTTPTTPVYSPSARVTYTPYSPFGGAAPAPIQVATPVQPLSFASTTTSTTPTLPITEAFTTISLDDHGKS